MRGKLIQGGGEFIVFSHNIQVRYDKSVKIVIKLNLVI